MENAARFVWFWFIISVFAFGVEVLGLRAQNVTVTDIDNNEYRTVRIGKQLWMAENLRTSKYADGSDIANVKDGAEWSGLTTGAWAHYDNDELMETVYGKLYNGYAVANAAGLCPQGWHVPTDEEWTQLSDFLGGESEAGFKMSVVGTDDAQGPDAGATSDSGFDALLGGNRDGGESAPFVNAEDAFFFWSSSETGSDAAWSRGYYYYLASSLVRTNVNLSLGLSVRCLWDAAPFTLSLSDAQTGRITSSSASVLSEVFEEDGLPVTRRGVVWGMTADLDLEVNREVVDAAEAGTGGFAVQITGLSPATSYHARAFAINSVGDTAYSAPVGFATRAEDAGGGGSGQAQTVTDIDGNVYSTVRIGRQVWMTENLRTSKYANGTGIVNVKDDAQWAGLRSGAWVHYANDTQNEAIYGKLYNHFAVRDSRGLCPSGWRMPKAPDMDTLVVSLDGKFLEQNTVDIGGKLKAEGTGLWSPPNEGATNESGFNALPGGLRTEYASFDQLGLSATFWMAEFTAEYMYSSWFDHAAWYALSSENQAMVVGSFDSKQGFSVRCMYYIDPLTVGDVQVSDITTTTATAASELTFDGGSAVTQRGVVWGKSPDVTLAVNSGIEYDASSDAGAFTVQLTGLTPSTSYHVRAFAVNADQDTAYSAPTPFMTRCDCAPGEPLEDINGNTYATVRIGNQLWMAENLRTTHYADGTEIPNVADAGAWSGLNSGAWVHYNLDAATKEKFGHYYNWHAVTNPAGLCPQGWRVPDHADWISLSSYLGGDAVSGGKLKAQGTDDWLTPNQGATNESGFAALPASARLVDGQFGSLGYLAGFWSYSEVNADEGVLAELRYDGAAMLYSRYFKTGGFSVRCLQGETYPVSVSMPVISNRTAVSIRLTAAVLTDGGSSVTQRGVVLATTGDPSLTNGSLRADADAPGLGEFTVDLASLEPSTRYFARAFGINADQDTAYSIPVSFTTLCAECAAGEPLSDVDGNTYATVQIGDQLWMAENLRTSRYADGSEIPNVTDQGSWYDATAGAWVNYENDDTLDAVFGKLYNWYAVADSRGLCPDGWHVPTDAEWTKLSDFLGGPSEAGGKMKATGLEYWMSPNTGATNESGFNALASGHIIIYRSFYDKGNSASFWSSSERDGLNASFNILSKDSPDLGNVESAKSNGGSVRCLRDVQASVWSVVLSAAPVTLNGLSVVEMSVPGLTVENRIRSYEFDLPLPAHVQVDSLPKSGTQSASPTGELAWNVVESEGKRVLKAAFADSELLTGGDLPLVRIAVRLTSGEPAELRPARFLLNTEEVAERGSVTLEIAPMLGDVDGNANIQAFDATLVLQYVVGMDPLPEVDPLPWEAKRVTAADVDGDGKVLAMDASWILQYIVELIADWPAITAGKAPPAPAVDVRSMGDELLFTAADEGLTSFQVELPIVEGLRYGEPSVAEIGDGWDALLAFNEDAEADVLRIALAGVKSATGEFLRVPYSLDLGLLDPELLDGARALPLEISAVANTEARTLGVELMASGTGVSTDPGSGEPLPDQFELRAVYPNPFNPATQLRFALPEASEIRLEVFDAAGRRVAVLAEGMRPAGVHAVTFEAGSLSSGVYIARFMAPGFVQSRTMVLLK